MSICNIRNSDKSKGEGISERTEEHWKVIYLRPASASIIKEPRLRRAAGRSFFRVTFVSLPARAAPRRAALKI